MKIHIIQHESFESPGAIIHWANDRGHEISYSKVYENERLPDENTIESIDMLIIMGGPQDPETTINECSHFNAKAEIECIKIAIESNKIVFGVCLGAQLIGEALGAKFEHSPNREIGFFELKMYPNYKNDDLFVDFPESFIVGHWHGDMPGLTLQSIVLAGSEGCQRQIVSYTQIVYGFQCHFEFTPDAIQGMIENRSRELEKYKELPYIQQADLLHKAETNTPNELLFGFFDKLVKRYNSLS